MPVRVQETVLCFGKKQQDNIATQNVTAEMWRLNKVNRDMVSAELVTEDDKDELGKGNEYVENVYPISRNVAFKLEKYLSSQIAAWAFCYGFGGFTPTGAGDPYQYVCIPLAASANLFELPYFTYLEEIRTGANPIVSSKCLIGCAVKGFQIDVVSGLGRASSKITIDCIGSGKVVVDGTHGIVIPSATAETLLPAQSLTLTSLTTNYGTLNQVLGFRMGWDNGITDDMSYRPGGGVGALGEAFRSQMLVGNRATGISLEFDVLMEPGAVEDAALIANTTGTLTAGLSNGADDSLTIVFQKVRYETVTPSEGPGGFVKVTVKCAPMWHSTNGLVTATIKTNTADICLVHS